MEMQFFLKYRYSLYTGRWVHMARRVWQHPFRRFPLKGKTQNLGQCGVFRMARFYPGTATPKPNGVLVKGFRPKL
jgi:hypothetical protein